jgi:hypothetical protein
LFENKPSGNPGSKTNLKIFFPQKIAVHSLSEENGPKVYIIFGVNIPQKNTESVTRGPSA